MAKGPRSRGSKRRTVQAPPPVGRGVVNRVNSVVVAEDEEVQWQWTHLPSPGGGRFVSGYTIIRPAAKPELPSPDPDSG